MFKRKTNRKGPGDPQLTQGKYYGPESKLVACPKGAKCYALCHTLPERSQNSRNLLFTTKKQNYKVHTLGMREYPLTQ